MTDKSRAVYSDELKEMQSWGMPMDHNGREIVEVRHNVVENGTYKPLPAVGEKKSTSK